MFRSVLYCVFGVVLVTSSIHAQVNITCPPVGGLQCTPDPITSSGTISLRAPVPVGLGGTGSTSFDAGAIPFSNGANLIGNKKLAWDAATNRLRAPISDAGGLVHDVRAYGAKGDGASDDTAFIQNAINAAGAAPTYLPAGTYLVTAPLRLTTPGASLTGAGVGATTIVTLSPNLDVIQMGSPTATVGTQPMVSVSDLSITSQVPRSGGAAIRVSVGEHYTIDNVRIGPMGGNGIDASSFAPNDPNVTTPTILFISRIVVEISNGPFSAVIINGAGACQLSHAFLRGPIIHDGNPANSIGLDIRHGGLFAFDVEIVQFERGVYIHPTTGQTIFWSTFDNVLSDSNTRYGFHILSTGTGQVGGLQFINCWSGSNGAQTPYVSDLGAGFRFENCDTATLLGCRVVNNGGHGIDVFSGTKNLEIGSGFVTGNSVARPRSMMGIAIEANTKNFRIHDVRSGSIAVTGEGINQGWGIYVVPTGCDNYIITGNDLTGNHYGGLYNGPVINAPPSALDSRIAAQNIPKQ